MICVSGAARNTLKRGFVLDVRVGRIVSCFIAAFMEIYFISGDVFPIFMPAIPSLYLTVARPVFHPVASYSMVYAVAAATRRPK
jgi:hypothetical protein